MTKFIGPEILVNLSDKDFFNKISNLNNLDEILPPYVKKSVSDKDYCTIEIEGYPKIKIYIKEKEPYKKVIFSSKENPISFSLICFITPNNQNCQARLEIHAKMNVIMKKMIEKPIKKFLEILSQGITKI